MSNSVPYIESEDNIFKTLGFEEGEAKNLKIRSDLMRQLTQIIESKKMSQRQAAQFFDVHQPRIHALMNGKIDQFTIDSLVNMLSKAGFSLEYRVIASPTT